MDGFCAPSLYELPSALDIADQSLHLEIFSPLVS